MAPVRAGAGEKHPETRMDRCPHRPLLAGFDHKLVMLDSAHIKGCAAEKVSIHRDKRSSCVDFAVDLADR